MVYMVQHCVCVSVLFNVYHYCGPPFQMDEDDNYPFSIKNLKTLIATPVLNIIHYAIKK